MGAFIYDIIEEPVFLRGETCTTIYCVIIFYLQIKNLSFWSLDTFIGDTSERHPDTETSK